MKIIQTFIFKTDFYEQIRHKLSFIYKKIVRDAYIRRKRLISKSDYKSGCKKPSLLGKYIFKNQKKNLKTQKTLKTPKKPLGWV